MLTRIGHCEQPVIRIPVHEQIQNRSSTVADDHGPKEWRPAFPKESFYVWVFVCEEGPVDRSGEDRNDDHYGDERGL